MLYFKVYINSRPSVGIHRGDIEAKKRAVLRAGGASLYGMYLLLCGYAGDRTFMRGYLVDHRGRPAAPKTIAETIGVTPAEVSWALRVLRRPEIGRVVREDYETAFRLELAAQALSEAGRPHSETDTQASDPAAKPETPDEPDRKPTRPQYTPGSRDGPRPGGGGGESDTVPATANLNGEPAVLADGGSGTATETPTADRNGNCDSNEGATETPGGDGTPPAGDDPLRPQAGREPEGDDGPQGADSPPVPPDGGGGEGGGAICEVVADPVVWGRVEKDEEYPCCWASIREDAGGLDFATVLCRALGFGYSEPNAVRLFKENLPVYARIWQRADAVGLDEGAKLAFCEAAIGKARSLRDQLRAAEHGKRKAVKKPEAVLTSWLNDQLARAVKVMAEGRKGAGE